MRNYEHFKIGNEIVLPDHKSAKAAWGLNSPEYLDSSDHDFLRQGHTTFPQGEIIFQLTKPSPSQTDQRGQEYGGGLIVVEAQDASGGYHEAGIHISKVVWDK
jgi:hypothetical protein